MAKKTNKNSNTTRVIAYKVDDNYKTPTTNLGKIIALIVTLILGILAGVVGVNIAINIDGTGATVDGAVRLELSEEQVPALVEDDQGELTEELYPTVEEVDGGQFEDATTGVSVVEGEYIDLGWSETYDVSSPEAFKNDTLDKCIIANNRFGAQCVSLSRVFWWSYADRDVSTCGTGAAKGMMNCAEQNAGDDFLIYWKEDAGSIQAGDWLIFDGGAWGHVGMALGPVVNGYVALLGENQGGKACTGGGSATNIINISIKNLIGYYRPKSYVKIEPAPEPEPEPIPAPGEDTDVLTYTVRKGDTLGEIARSVCNYTDRDLFGDDGYAEKLAQLNGIENRGLIYPGQIVKCAEY